MNSVPGFRILLPVLVLMTAGCIDIGNSKGTGTMADISNGMSRLSQETSAYLLAHADNPVNWYPWGEGAFYTWSHDEISGMLSPTELKLAVEYWNITESGNFTEAGRLYNQKNILHLTLENDSAALTSPGELQDAVSVIRRTLLLTRESRPRPFRDEKILTDWNGLMIAALARASVVLKKMGPKKMGPGLTS